MRILTSTILAAALAVAVPAYAHDGHGRPGQHYGHGHHKHHHAQGRHHHRPHPPGWGPRREVNNYYYGYGVPAAAVPPGVHVVFPDIFLPWP